MRAAIAAAVVGDEQKREDPTVTALQERVAALLGHEAALFVPTATMANQIALKLHGRPGDVLIAEETSHVLVYEYGGAAAHAGLVTRGLPGLAGRITPEQVRAAASAEHEGRRPARGDPLARGHAQQRRRPCLAARRARSRARRAREHGLATHLDGARLLNAAVAQGVAPAEIGSRFDTVTLCLSKGLGCPLGALLAGSREPSWSGPGARSTSSAAPCGRRASSRRRACTRSTTTSSGWPTTTRARGVRRRARRRRRARGSRPASRRTSSRSTSALLGLDARRDALAALKANGVGLSATIPPDGDPRRHASRHRRTRTSSGPSSVLLRPSWAPPSRRASARRALRSRGARAGYQIRSWEPLRALTVRRK